MAWWLTAFGLVTTLSIAGGMRTRTAWASRAACHGPDEPELPRGAEFALHWILGASSHSLPGDLGEEYTEKLAAGWRQAEADRWYCEQVFNSVAALMASQLASVLRPTSRIRG